MNDKRTTKTFSVDGTRVLLLPAGPMLVHAIIRERDFTHNRLAGFAHTMEDAHLWAASADMLAALEDLLAACEADAGSPGPDDSDNEPVGWQGGNGAGGVNEQATPMALTFGMMRAARAAIAKAKP